MITIDRLLLLKKLPNRIESDNPLLRFSGHVYKCELERLFENLVDDNAIKYLRGEDFV